VHDLDDTLPPVQGQEGLGTLGHPVHQLTIGQHHVQILAIGLA
jgi:hypothetical protein